MGSHVYTYKGSYKRLSFQRGFFVESFIERSSFSGGAENITGGTLILSLKQLEKQGLFIVRPS
jgi:hypothetical protein